MEALQADCQKYTVKQLRALAKEHKISLVGCTKKQEIIQTLILHLRIHILQSQAKLTYNKHVKAKEKENNKCAFG